MKNPIFSSVVLALSAGFVFIFSGCTSWKEGVQQDVILKSNPEGAAVTINGYDVGKTPLLAKMRTKNIYSISFKKDGYRAFETIIYPETDLPFVRTGLFTDTGRYNTLKPNPVDASMVADLVPETASIDPYADLVMRTMSNDQNFKDGKISAAEHKMIAQQLINAYAPKN